MFYVYVLFSLKDRKLYVGYSADLKRRILKHRTGMVSSTYERLPVRLIYYEAYLSSAEAMKREKYLKGGNGRRQLKIQLGETLEKLGYKYLSNEDN